MDNLITEIISGEPYQYYPYGEHIVRATGLCGDDRPSILLMIELFKQLSKSPCTNST